MADALLWLDFETDGLDTATCVPLEYHAAVTPYYDPLTIVDEITVVIGAWERDREPVPDDYVQKMHEDSGLWDDCRASTTNEEVARATLTYVALSAGRRFDRVLLAGSGVHFDRAIVNQQWGGDVFKPLHYRVVDVSVLREAARMAGVALYERNRLHRAKADVDDSRAELVYYRDMLVRGGRDG